MSQISQDLQEAHEDFVQQMHERDRTGETPLPLPKDESNAEKVERTNDSVDEDADAVCAASEPAITSDEIEAIMLRRKLFDEAKRKIHELIIAVYYEKEGKESVRGATLSVQECIEKVNETFLDMAKNGESEDFQFTMLLQQCVANIETHIATFDYDSFKKFTAQVIGNFFAPVFKHQSALLGQIKDLKKQIKASQTIEEVV